ncbi:hypothetical protein MMC07_001888 [Pseudocyphellaria aurata]|nr:hypothetical protein [Pseudocyphellaria aurata]
MELDTMDETSPQTPKPNELMIPDDEAYARTNIEMGEIADILMKLVPIKLEDLDLNDRVCAICRAEFFVSEDAKISHDPVRASCGHVFGKRCIIRWLDPFCAWGLKAEDDPEIDPEARLYESTNSHCPYCRRHLCPKSPIEPMEIVAHRLSFWDMAYASAGVERSEREESTRKSLWQYVEYCRSIDEHEVDRETELDHQRCAQMLLLDFALALKIEKLTPEQEILRQRLERISRKDLERCSVQDGRYFFDIDSDDNEVVEVGFSLMESGFKIESSLDNVEVAEMERDMDEEGTNQPDP